MPSVITPSAGRALERYLRPASGARVPEHIRLMSGVLSRVVPSDQIACVLYAAKSTEDIRGSNVTQMADCREAVDAGGGREIVAEFADEKASGFSANRGPGLEAALRRAEHEVAAGRAAELWVQHSDRLARGDGRVARHTVELALWGLKADVKIRCVQDDQTFDDLLFALLAGRASHGESVRKGRAVAAGLKRAAERGEHGGSIADGYRIAIDVVNGEVIKRLEFDPDRRHVFDLLFSLAVSGSTVSEIVRRLNSESYWTKPWRRKHSPAPFTRQGVRRILRNPRYAGLSVNGGQIVGEGQWPGYITAGQHAAIVAAIPRRPRADPSNAHASPSKAHAPFLLTPLAVCGICGSKMTGVSVEARRQDGLRSRRYVCRAHQEPGGCPAPPVDAAVVDRAVVLNFSAILGLAPRDLRRDTPLAGQATAGRVASSLPGFGETATRLKHAAATAAATGQLRLAQNAIEELVSLSYRAGQRAASASAVASSLTGTGTDPLAQLRSWIEEDLSGKNRCTREHTARLTGFLADRIERVSLLSEGDSMRIDVFPRADATTIPGDPDPLSAGPPRRPRTIRAHRGSWETARRLAGYKRRIHTCWTDKEILEAIRRWTIAHGRTPTSHDWATATIENPTADSVTKRFGGWQQAIRASTRPSGAAW